MYTVAIEPNEIRFTCEILSLCLLLFIGCGDVDHGNNEADSDDGRIQLNAFQGIVDSLNLEGAVLIYDQRENVYFSNDFEWVDQGFLPASTFKIPHSIIALETKVVESENTVFAYHGESRWLEAWEQDLTFAQAFKLSCLPCYQEVAPKIGVDTMRVYLQKLDYGNMDVTPENLDQFWVGGNSRITPREQVEFLQRFFEKKLPIQSRTYRLMQEIMELHTGEYTLYGKTGWSVDGDQNNGWFVGILASAERTYYFASNVEPGPGYDLDHFTNDRKRVTYLALKDLGLETPPIN